MPMMPRRQHNLDRALAEWRDQTAAQFGRRAHAQLGRGFVILDAKDRFVYVTRLASAPFELVNEIQKYVPEEEAVVVHEDQADRGVLIVRRIRIETRQ